GRSCRSRSTSSGSTGSRFAPGSRTRGAARSPSGSGSRWRGSCAARDGAGAASTTWRSTACSRTNGGPGAESVRRGRVRPVRHARARVPQGGLGYLVRALGRGARRGSDGVPPRVGGDLGRAADGASGRPAGEPAGDLPARRSPPHAAADPGGDAGSGGAVREVVRPGAGGARGARAAAGGGD